MAYRDVLDVVARLHVERGFREAFLAAPEEALAGTGLPEAERRSLVRLDPVELRRIGRIADHHRRTRVEEHIPWASPATRPELRPLLEGFFAEVPPQLLNREEAIAFCRHVERLGSQPVYLPELARYERLRLEVAWGLTPPGRQRFEAPVHVLAARLEAPGWPEPPASGAPTWLELRKVPGLPAVLVREVP